MTPSTTPPPLIIPDTNVIVSGVAVSDHAPHRIFRAWRDQKVGFALCEPILREIFEVLTRPYFVRKGWAASQAAALVEDIRKGSLLVPGTTPVAVCQDPDDNVLFACALEAQADYIVSGDQHVLAIGTYQGIPTLTPNQFVDLYAKQEKEPARHKKAA